jgi:hypothetical protein
MCGIRLSEQTVKQTLLLTNFMLPLKAVSIFLVLSLYLQATDDDGKGQSAVASLMISVLDNNDNPPQFTNNNYDIAIDEGATKFETRLQVQV